MTQNVINTGNVANDGQGDPLRTAFNETNLNFNQIWAAGPVDSNIQIANNTIQATNTNGNIILATNGIGVVVPAASIVPDIGNVRMLGSASSPFNTVYTQYVTANSAEISGNLYVAGNLLVTGNTVTVNRANLDIANTTITLSANATSPAQANGSGLLVAGANASFTYGATGNNWISNLSISAPAFIGDGSQLTNVSATTAAESLTGNTIASTVLYSNLQSVGTLANLTVGGNVVGNLISANGITANTVTATFIGNGSGLTAITGSAVTGNVGNANYATYAGTALTANLAAVATQAVNADTALVALNANYANTANTSTFAQLANVANTACMADVANSAVVAGRAETIDTQTTITVTGNIVTGGILTDYYYFANGTPATFGNGGNANTGNIRFNGDTIYDINGMSLINGNLTYGTTSSISIPAYGDTSNALTMVNTYGDVLITAGTDVEHTENLIFDRDGILNLPAGHGYSYTATLTGYGSGTAQIAFELVSDFSGVSTEWMAGITVPGTGYNIGETFTFDSEFLRIPNASVRIVVASVDVNGAITNLDFTAAPLYPTSIQRNGAFIALQADNHRWTFGLNGNLTLPATINGAATAVTLNPGLTVGYTTAVNVPTIANTGYGTGLTVDIIADTGNAGSITSVTLNQRGQGYAPGDQLQVDQPLSTGNGELTVVSIADPIVPSINYANGDPYGGGTGNYGNANVAAFLPTYTGNLNANLLYTGNVNPGSIPTNVGLVVDNGDSPTAWIGHYDPANVASHGYLQFSAAPLGNGAFINTDSTFLDITNGGDGGIINLSTGYLGSESWVFDSAANLTLPQNTSLIKYPNGQPYGGVIQSNAAPSNPTASTIWYDTVTGRTYVYYNDGVNTQWVDSSPAGEDFGNVAANIIPNANATFTLGSTTNQWANIYTGNVLANSFFYSNGQPFTSGGVIQSNVAPSSPTDSTLWYDEVTGRLYVYYTNQWVDAAPAGEDFGNVDANVIPNANATFTLGSTTNQWANIYTGGILTDGYYYANGAPFVSGNYGDSNVEALLASGSITGNVLIPTLVGNVVGNLISGSNHAGFDAFGDFVLPSSTYFGMYANMGMAVTANTTGGTISAPQSGQSLTLNTNSGAPNYNWVFDSNGTATFPLSSTIFERGVGDWRHGLNIVGETDNSSVLIYNYGTDGKGFGASALYVNNSNVEIITNNQRSGGPGETWTFDNAGNLTAPGNITATNLYSTGVVSAAGNVYGNTFIGNGNQLSNVAKQTTGSWTLAPGVNTVSFTVTPGGNYSMWVNGNIPNGIVLWNATVSTSNTNVPVVGTQYGWYYAAGGALVLTSIPSQIVGTAGAISTATVVTTTSNVFTFDITNNSGTPQVINWGYTTLSE